jgi:hypothetical protein
VKISIHSDIDQASKWITDFGRQQLPFATAVALNKTAELVQAAEVKEMRDVFDRPTPYTLNSLYVKRATKSNLEAEVKLKDDVYKGTPAAKYLLPEIVGGLRRLKRFEKALQSVGAMPPGYFAVPGAAAKVDQFGNLDRGLIVQVLSYFKAFSAAGYHANITAARREKIARGTKKKIGYEYFVGAPAGGKLPLGIWQRFHLGHGSAIKPIIIFMPHAIYREVFDFQYVADRVVAKNFAGEFDKAFAMAIATAK